MHIITQGNTQNNTYKNKLVVRCDKFV